MTAIVSGEEARVKTKGPSVSAALRLGSGVEDLLQPEGTHHSNSCFDLPASQNSKYTLTELPYSRNLECALVSKELLGKYSREA
jgi:hypothetical protein